MPHGPFMVAVDPDGKSVINLDVADWWAQKRDQLFATFGFGPFVITVDPTGKLVWSGPFSMAVDSDGKVVGPSGASPARPGGTASTTLQRRG